MASTSLRVIFLGPPGAGKGTQASRLASRHGLAHISSGDLFRAEVGAATELGRELRAYVDRGDLVPDELVLRMLAQPVLAAAAQGGFVLDGFPRTLDQALMAHELAQQMGVTAHGVLLLEAPVEVLVQRLLARGETSGRADDREAVIRHRLEVHAANEGPITEYYEGRGVLYRIDATPPPDDVAAVIGRIAASLGGGTGPAGAAGAPL